MLSGGGETIDAGVRGGRNSGGLGYVRRGVLEVHFSLKRQKERDNDPEDGLEEGGRDTSFNESPKLSQHEELHDLKPHGSKVV